MSRFATLRGSVHRDTRRLLNVAFIPQTDLPTAGVQTIIVRDVGSVADLHCFPSRETGIDYGCRR